MTTKIKNPKIREIALQVGGSHYPEVGGELLEKFAELLVQECCNIFLELRTRPADLAVLDVKEHFGVK